MSSGQKHIQGMRIEHRNTAVLISLRLVRLLPIALLSALAAQPMLAATVEVDVGVIGCTITVQGQIDRKTPGQFQAAVHRANDSSRKQRNQPCDPEGLWPGKVIFNSPGGDVESAIALGKIIRQTSFRSEVVRLCASACVIAFLGGVNRVVWPGGGNWPSSSLCQGSKRIIKSSAGALR